MSVADQLRREQQRALACKTPAERVALALSLGRRDLKIFMAKSGLDEASARRELRRRRQLGRITSRAAGE
jgi:hypothetical protein